MVCKQCAQKMHFIRERTCIRCGRVLQSRYEEVCAECARDMHVFDGALAPFSYSGEIRESLVRFKYHGRAEYAAFYAACIWQYGQERIRAWRPELLVPVPVHRSRYAERGYNQAGLIARELEKLSGIPAEERLVVRKKKTVAQKELGSAERRENLDGAFAYAGKERVPARVMIVDDILTTGSTADALCNILRSNGAEYIYVVCAGVS